MSAVRKVNDNKDAGGVVLLATPPVSDYILYKIIVSGAQPEFTLTETDTGKVLLSAPPPIRQTYERRWPKQGTDTVRKGDFHEHDLGMTFRKAVTYRIVVEQYDSQDNLIAVLKDVEWSSQTPTDAKFEPFTVSIPQV